MRPESVIDSSIEFLDESKHVVAAVLVALVATVAAGIAFLDGLLLLVPPVLLFSLLLLHLVFRHDLVLLCGLIVLFGPVSGYEEGFQLSEALYGIAYLTYLGAWFGSRFIVGWKLKGIADNSLFLFLLWITVCFPLTIVFGGDLKIALSEWLALSMLGFYFPIKEQIAKNPEALRYIAYSCLVLVLWIAVRNFLEYFIGLANAEQVWAIAKTRVTTNELVMLVAATTFITLFAYVKPRIPRTIAFGLGLLFSAAVVITQSRAVWVSLALAVFVVFLLSPGKIKRRLISFGCYAIGLAFLIGPLLLEDFTRLVSNGLIFRLASLGSAASVDISLINRFVEAAAAFDAAKAFPITGYGLGVSYTYYSLVYELSYQTTFVHNTFVGVFFKHGAIGLALISTFSLGILISGIRLVGLSLTIPKLIGTIAVATIIAFALAGTTSNLFTRSDITFVIVIIAAATNGVLIRTQRPNRLG